VTPSQRQAAQKRQRLVDAAWQLFYRRGVARTTLGQIAAEADVPLGGVYYYFRTREDIVEAVLDAHKRHLTAVLAGWDAATPDALERLGTYLRAQAENAGKLAADGCQHTRLTFDLGHEDAFRARAGEILELYLRWAQRQFELLGRRDARGRALELVGRVQGAITLSSTLHQPDVLIDETQRLHAWLAELRGPLAVA
jgi:AcrR family transcriptional regulator